MISETTLNNLYKYVIENYLRSVGVKKLKEKLYQDRRFYRNSAAVIEEELAHPNSNLNVYNLDNFLFDNLFNKNNTYQIVWKLTNHFISVNNLQTIDEINAYLAHVPSLKFNQNLSNIRFTIPYLFEICSTRISVQDNTVKRVNVLVKTDPVTKGHGDVYCFIGVVLDLVNDFLIVKINKGRYDAHSDKIGFINRIQTSVIQNLCAPLNIEYECIDEVTSQMTIFRIFHNLSIQAENAMNQSVTIEIEHKIRDFIDSVGINENRDYYDQIKSVIYQNIASGLSELLFPNGWPFRFIFKEGDFSSATSRTEDYEPIYRSKIYWALKTMVIREGKLLEAGFKFLRNGNNPIFVKIIEYHEAIVLQYYLTEYNKGSQEEKENEVLRKVKEHL